MVHNITVAWAMPVRSVDLGARLETYAETRATITTFRLCVKYAARESSLSRLPPEMVEIVTSHINEPIFQQRRQEWAKAESCCANDCSALDHFTEEEIREMKIDIFKGLDEDELSESSLDEYINEHIMDECLDYDTHLWKVDQHYYQIDENRDPNDTYSVLLPNEKKRFTSAKKVSRSQTIAGREGRWTF